MYLDLFMQIFTETQLFCSVVTVQWMQQNISWINSFIYSNESYFQYICTI